MILKIISDLYFFCGLGFVYFHIWNFINPSEGMRIYYLLKKKGYFLSDASDRPKSCAYGVLQMFYAFWTIIGMFIESQRASFVILFFVGIIVGFFRSYLNKRGIARGGIVNVSRSLESFICMNIIGDIIMVHFFSSFWGVGFIKWIIG